MNRAPIIGRFLKSPDGRMNGSTEYRAKGHAKLVLRELPYVPCFLLMGTYGLAPEQYPTRKAAIERIEQLLSA